LPKGQRPAASAPEGSPPHAVVAANKLPVLATAAAKLDYLRTRNVGDCQRCGLARTRQHLVFGVGDAGAEVMFVGEAPGAEEDARGEPFVGAAGRRLDEWLATVELVRSSVYIANVLKCRPPRNRDPEPDEIAKCSPFLHAQIRAIGPRVIVALGRFAGQQLLGGDGTLASMRGQGRWYVEPKSNTRIPVVVTYHPSYVLRREAESQRDAGRKSENDAVIEDLRIALAHVERR
jgi:DNA polymerase